jgi:hypothetical protein
VRYIPGFLVLAAVAPERAFAIGESR